MNVISFIANNNYGIYNKDMAKAIGLVESILLGELASEYDYYYKNNMLDNEWFFSTVENVEEQTTLTDYQQRKALNKLKELGIIEVKIKGVPPKRYIKINQELILKILNIQFSKNLRIESQKTKETYNNNNINNNNNSNNIKDNSKKETTSLAKEIIDYLNLKTGKHFKYTQNNIKKIETRLKEFNAEDFKTVIDNKTKEWLNDSRMNCYLRPETLFGSKFESYLNQKQNISNNPFIDILKEEYYG